MPPMFRLDVLAHDGTPIPDAVGDALATANHMSTARRLALDLAAWHERDVLVTRQGGGTERAVLLIRPDGTADAPAGMIGACTRHDNVGPCFCAACRARRKARA